MEADGGTIGGSISHEYHILADVGEDKLLNCINCGFLTKSEAFDAELDCPGCKTNLSTKKGIEVRINYLSTVAPLEFVVIS